MSEARSCVIFTMLLNIVKAKRYSLLALAMLGIPVRETQVIMWRTLGTLDIDVQTNNDTINVYYQYLIRILGINCNII